MNLFNLDFTQNYKDILDALVIVYGSQYKELIEYKLSRILIISYINKEGLASYIKALKNHPKYKDEDLTEYENFLQKEEQREKEIKQRKTNEIIEELKNILPSNIKEAFLKFISNNDFEIDLGYKSKFEYFSEEDEEVLNSKDASEFEKRLICAIRLATLEKLGVQVGNPDDAYDTYKKLIEKEEVKALMPSKELVSIITKIRNKKFQEFEREKIIESETFLEKLQYFKDGKLQLQLYEIIKDRKVCISPILYENMPIPAMFFTILPNTIGALDYIILHELIHGVEVNFISKDIIEYICGFEIIRDDDNTEDNQYNKKYRKYERMNETITDILAIETRSILHSKGVYFIEDKELINLDILDKNTSSILKEIVSPLLTKVRKEVLEARLTGNLSILWYKIGYENYEAINDIVNRVDYLIQEKNLAEELKKENNQNKVVREYRELMQKLNEIYMKIDEKISEEKKKI